MSLRSEETETEGFIGRANPIREVLGEQKLVLIPGRAGV